MGNSIWRYKGEYLLTYWVPNLVNKSAITNTSTGKTVEVWSHILLIDKIPSEIKKKYSSPTCNTIIIQFRSVFIYFLDYRTTVHLERQHKYKVPRTTNQDKNKSGTKRIEFIYLKHKHTKICKWLKRVNRNPWLGHLMDKTVPKWHEVRLIEK